MKRKPPAAFIALPVIALPVVALLAGAACSGADRRRAAADGASQGDAGKKEPAAMRVVRNEKAVEVEAGEGIDLVVLRPVAIPFELRYEWPESPSIEGDSVRFVRVRIEPPPPEADGGVTTHHYEIQALKPGTARVILVPKLAGPTAVQPPRVLAVTVRAASSR